VADLYAVYHTARPRTAPTATPDTRKHLRRILVECGNDLDSASLLLVWHFQSQDERARQARGEIPWPGDGKPRAMMALEQIASKVGSRLEMAREWDARGRREDPPAVFGRAAGAAHAPRRSSLLDQLSEPDGRDILAPRPNSIDTEFEVIP
jgi:hypothetical protein